MKDLWQLKREFLEYGEIEKGQSLLTIENYNRYLTRFLTWLENNIEETTRSHTDNSAGGPVLNSGHPESTQSSRVTSRDLQSISGSQGMLKPFGLAQGGQVQHDKEGFNSDSSVAPPQGHFGKDQNDKKNETQNDDDRAPSLQPTTYNLLPSAITQEVVRKYRLYINRLTARDGRELKGATQNHHALAVRAFLRYLSMRGEASLAPEKVTLAKASDREVTFLNTDEYGRLLEVPNVQKSDGLRDKSLIEVLFSTGMRVSELIALNVGQINFGRGEIAVLGKGKKMRVVFLSDFAKDLLVKYLASRGVLKNEETTRLHTVLDTEVPKEVSPRTEDTVLDTENGGDNTSLNSKIQVLSSTENEPLFLSSRGSRMNARGIERMISKYAKIAGITKQVTPHTLRHTFATDMLSAGADIRSVQSLLGHSNISTTQVYTHVTDQHLREIHQKFHGVKADTTQPPNSHPEEADELLSLRGTKQSNE